MIEFKQKVFGAAATVGLIIASSAPAAFANTSFDITGNGYNSDNTISLTQHSENTLIQTNQSSVENRVSVHSQTGGVNANGNTGGDTKINTGSSNATVGVFNASNLNFADMGNCGCQSQGDMSFKISGNGAHSDNQIEAKTENNSTVAQGNDSEVQNNIRVESSTGNLEANHNTNGSVDMRTGNSSTDIWVKSFSNANFFGNNNPFQSFMNWFSH